MIKLEGITKVYGAADMKVEALKGISINFRESEFVSILGPSGCGKTTLLNIIGGLDHYTDGNLMIDDISTKDYKDRDWDTYRNHRVGFVFQSYNLIPHQNILENVELALNIAGVKREERIERAKKALDRVGLKDLYNKKPNQLSGGQCQRVAIARALVNEPEILLADEPTGALDTETSIQIMEIIKEIAKDTLVIMVTHNPELAERYSTRIIRLLDGEIISDSHPFDPKLEKSEKPARSEKTKKSKLGFWSAFRLSARNLWSKFKRTLIVCIAGSIGIIGVASVLSVSVGIQSYIRNMENDMLSGNPVQIQETTLDMSALMSNFSDDTKRDAIKQATKDGYVNVEQVMDYLVDMAGRVDNLMIQNDINSYYVQYVLDMPKEYYSAINLDYGVNIINNIYTKSPFTNQESSVSLQTIKDVYTAILTYTDLQKYASLITTLDDIFSQLPSDKDFILSQYDIISDKNTASYPTSAYEIALVVNGDTELSDLMLVQLGYYSQDEFLNMVYKALKDPKYNPELEEKTSFSYEELLGKKFTWYPNNSVFSRLSGGSSYTPFSYNPTSDDFTDEGIELTITSILRPKKNLSYGSLNTGFYYTSALTEEILKDSKNSDIVKYLESSGQDSFTSGEFDTGLGKIQSGIKYDFTFQFDNEEKTITSYLGSQNMLSSFMSSMASTAMPNYYTLTKRDLGGVDLPSTISVYPVNFQIKDKMTAYLDKWNGDQDIVVNGETLTKDSELRPEIRYSDNLGLVIDMISSMISMVTTALVAFTALSLVVSTVMISIITYVSVIERIKEIGVIRSLGGRKRDVSRLFIAESVIIGGISGVFGIIVTLLITLLINGLAHITIATLTIPIALIMIAIGVGLTLISGLIPARAASKKDPVVALRSE